MPTTLRGDVFYERVAGDTALRRLHPRVAAFLREYLAGERVAPWGDRWVLSTHFPPYPSPAFDRLVEALEPGTPPRLYSVTLGVTNRCPYGCWHCYNAGRCTRDTPLAVLLHTARQLQDLGAVMVALSGGEPLLRRDLDEVAAAFDARTCLTLNTTGWGLTPRRARALAGHSLFAVGVSLNSADEAEHDRLRGRPGAYRTALTARDLDLVLACWSLGYIPVGPFLAAAAQALRPGGRLALVVHRQDSPREPLEIFARLVAQEPGILRRRVWFEFPRDAAQVQDDLSRVRFGRPEVWEGQVAFPCASAEEALDHLLQSGAGTAFNDAIAPDRRESLRRAFVRSLAERHPAGGRHEVVHEYVAAMAVRTGLGSGERAAAVQLRVTQEVAHGHASGVRLAAGAR